jgi:hypothetical protein
VLGCDNPVMIRSAQVADPPLAGQTYRERAAAGAAAFAVPGMVGRLGDHGGDAAGSQMPSDHS